MAKMAKGGGGLKNLDFADLRLRIALVVYQVHPQEVEHVREGFHRVRGHLLQEEHLFHAIFPQILRANFARDGIQTAETQQHGRTRRSRENWFELVAIVAVGVMRERVCVPSNARSRADYLTSLWVEPAASEHSRTKGRKHVPLFRSLSRCMSVSRSLPFGLHQCVIW